MPADVPAQRMHRLVVGRATVADNFQSLGTSSYSVPYFFLRNLRTLGLWLNTILRQTLENNPCRP